MATPQVLTTVLTIAEAAEAARCSRATIERALAAYREDPTTGLKHSRRTPLNRGKARKTAMPKGRVYIQESDLARWMKGLPPEVDESRPAGRPPRPETAVPRRRRPNPRDGAPKKGDHSHDRTQIQDTR